MSFASEIAALSRIPVTLIKIKTQRCWLTFGSSPCTATGNKCFNTYASCKDKNNFAEEDATYKFTDADVPAQILGAYPLLQKNSALVTEIKQDKLITAREQFSFVDDTDSDIANDPYWSDRGYTAIADVPGTFWKRWLARNPNYQGKTIERYQGFSGMAEADYQLQYTGKIDKINRGSLINVDSVDLLKDLSTIDLPEKNAHKLNSDLDTSLATVSLSDEIALWAATGYVRIGDEIIYYAAKDNTTRQLTGCLRARFGTTAASHAKNTRVQLCRYYYGNPFDILLEMLQTDAALDAGFIDATSFEDWRDIIGTDIIFEAVISETTKLQKLYFEIVEQMDCRCWVNEAGKITIRRNFPNFPDLTGTLITDDNNIVVNSPLLDLNEDSRITRVSWYTDGLYTKSNDDEENYAKLDIAIDGDAEDFEYGEEIGKTIKSRWIHSTNQNEDLVRVWIRNYMARVLFSRRNATPILTFTTDLKDINIITGDVVRISTDELVYQDGTPFSNELFLIIKREPLGATIKFTAEYLGVRKIAFIAPDATNDYDASTWNEKLYGFITNADGRVGENEYSGYRIF